MARRDSFARKETTQRLVKTFKTAVEWDSWGQIEEANKVCAVERRGKEHYAHGNASRLLIEGGFFFRPACLPATDLLLLHDDRISRTVALTLPF